MLLEVDYGELVRRISGRRTCADCGRVFNLLTSPPTAANGALSDRPAQPHRLVQRPDDNEATVSRATAGLRREDPAAHRLLPRARAAARDRRRRGSGCRDAPSGAGTRGAAAAGAAQTPARGRAEGPRQEDRVEEARPQEAQRQKEQRQKEQKTCATRQACWQGHAARRRCQTPRGYRARQGATHRLTTASAPALTAPLERRQQPLAQQRPTPAAQHRSLAGTVGQLLQVAARGQHLRRQSEFPRHRLRDRNQLLDERGFERIGPSASRGRR